MMKNGKPKNWIVRSLIIFAVELHHPMDYCEDSPIVELTRALLGCLTLRFVP